MRALSNKAGMLSLREQGREEPTAPTTGRPLPSEGTSNAGLSSERPKTSSVPMKTVLTSGTLRKGLGTPEVTVRTAELHPASALPASVLGAHRHGSLPSPRLFQAPGLRTSLSSVDTAISACVWLLFFTWALFSSPASAS